MGPTKSLTFSRGPKFCLEGKRKIIDSKVPFERGYVIVPRGVLVCSQPVAMAVYSAVPLILIKNVSFPQ